MIPELKANTKELFNLHLEYEKYLYLRSVENDIESEFKRLKNKFGYSV